MRMEGAVGEGGGEGEGKGGEGEDKPFSLVAPLRGCAELVCGYCARPRVATMQQGQNEV